MTTEQLPRKRGRPRKDRPDGALFGGTLKWYEANKGLHRCQDVAKSTGFNSHQIAVVSRRLHERGLIQRHEVPVPDRPTPVVMYGVI